MDYKIDQKINLVIDLITRLSKIHEYKVEQKSIIKRKLLKLKISANETEKHLMKLKEREQSKNEKEIIKINNEMKRNIKKQVNR
jgi:hypothetical protein